MWNIKVIASAEGEENIKQYLYMRWLVNGEIACMEIDVSKEVETMTLLIKSENEELAGFVSKYIEGFMKLN